MISTPNRACSLIALQRVCQVEKKLFLSGPELFGTQIALNALRALGWCSVVLRASMSGSFWMRALDLVIPAQTGKPDGMAHRLGP